jgi:glycosyltransferase involved in cell wall biosynthesis
VPTYNEEDIIGWTVAHLVQQGLQVVIIDTGSTDDTLANARVCGAGPAIVHMPAKDGRVRWREVLETVEALAAKAAKISADWSMLCDADEIRRSPVPGERLIDSFARINETGYNAAEFQVLTFHPVDNGFDGSQNPEEYFRYYTRDLFNERIGQVKAWKNTPDRPAMIAWSGGHRLRFMLSKDGNECNTDPRVHPQPLISKHYPIRSQAHGERKVFTERRGRWADPEKDWHVQYNGIEPGHSFLKRPEDCKEWK